MQFCFRFHIMYVILTPFHQVHTRAENVASPNREQELKQSHHIQHQSYTQEQHRRQGSKEYNTDGGKGALTDGEIIEQLTNQRFRGQSKLSGDDIMHPYARYMHVNNY